MLSVVTFTIMNNKVKNLTKELLSDYKCKLEKVNFDYHRSDGSWQPQQRVVFSRKDASVVLLYNTKTKNIILTKQFRLPTYFNGNESGMLMEACAGTIDDNETPEDCITREIEEETGYKIEQVAKIFEAFLTPGSVTEKLYFFTAEYSENMKQNEGGGTDETEDIEVMEIPFEQAFLMFANGEIQDAKTILLLQHAKLNKLVE